MIPTTVLRHRDMSCAACKTPCAHAADPAVLAHPCSACPLTPPAWPQWDCVPGAAPTPLGDRLHTEIKTRILDRARPYAPAIVAAIEQCGGCRSDRRHLNGGKIAGEDAGPPIV
jgi:hypothetical protein